MSQLSAASVKPRAAWWAPQPSKNPRNHFDGWQLGVLAVVIAWGSALVMVPRTVVPDRVPLPVVAPGARAELLTKERTLADRAKAHTLDLPVRKLGADVREVGRTESTEGSTPSWLVERIRADGAEAVRTAPEQVLELRAYQSELFARAVYAWSATGQSSAALIELGGSISKSFATAGWVKKEGARTHVVIDELALRAMFKTRWNELTGLDGPAFALDLDEQRAVAAFAIARSAAELDARPAIEGDPVASSLLTRVQDLGRVDPTYPTRFAEGIVHFKSANYTGAIDAFARYLQAAPDGPYALRARNFMKAALEGAQAAGD
ncbi:MAG: hypothetical protein U0414_05780 [Polyangiaceae bacterium]